MLNDMMPENLIGDTLAFIAAKSKPTPKKQIIEPAKAVTAMNVIFAPIIWRLGNQVALLVRAFSAAKTKMMPIMAELRYIRNLLKLIEPAMYEEKLCLQKLLQTSLR